MSQTIDIDNFDSNNIVAQTQLSSDLTSTSVTTLPVNNSSGMSSGYIIIGALGSSTSEMLIASAAPTSTSITTSSGTLLQHNFNDPVTLLFGNQINVYRANDVAGNGTQPPDANFNKISTVTITANRPFTAYTDASGTAGQWYKFTYYDSTSTGETLLSDSVAVQAGAVHYVSLDQIRRAAGFRTNLKVTDDIIAEKRDAAEREINGALTALYQFPLPQPTNPIVQQIALNIAAGELMHEEYLEVNPAMAAEGEAKADMARHGGGSHTSLDELRDRSVVLEDANYNELVTEEGQGVAGWPDETTELAQNVYGNPNVATPPAGNDYGFQATIDEVF